MNASKSIVVWHVPLGLPIGAAALSDWRGGRQSFEQGCANPHDRRAFLDRDLEIVAHPHR